MKDFLLVLPVLLFSVVAHEYAHAWTAYRQGDPTAHMLGRLTLNPIPHIDPFMSILFPVGLWFLSHGTFTFGSAKPVPINPRNFRNYRRGDLIVSSAGIVTNVMLALACAVVFAVLGIVGKALPLSAEFLGLLQRMMFFGIFLNYVLAVFNLVPLPPLDGSHIFYHLLPPALGARYRAVGRYGFLVLLVTFMVPGLSGVWDVLLWPAGAASGLTLGAVGRLALPGALTGL
ncbi:MAG TPA: site-2 protease family protein [Gemmatimonadales bacterium]|nr:site-2 protease family protein [Gemmatimonadales bacterium]